MRFTLLTFVAGLIAAVAAQSTENPFKVEQGFMIQAGKPTTIKWDPTTQGPVSLTLRSGASSDLNKGTVVAPNIPNTGSYTFTVPSDTTRNSDYTLAIAPVSDPSEQNFTPQFVVESSNTVASTTGDSSASTATSTGSRTASPTSTGSSASTTSTNTRSSSAPSGSSSRTESGSSSSSTAATQSESTAAEPAPSDNAATINALNVQGGMAAVILGFMAVL